MSMRFPPLRENSAPAERAELRLHSGKTDGGELDGLEWVRWLFQSVRAQRTALVFQSQAPVRVALLEEWREFVEGVFLPVLAPALLRAWRAAHQGDDEELAACDRALRDGLCAARAERSIAGGSILLERTRGAKFQAALGRYRGRVEGGESPGHLAVVWSAVAALFQLPPLDLLSEYLREEWLTATQHFRHHDDPQGPLGFSALAVRSLHAAGVHADFSKELVIRHGSLDLS